MQFSPILMEMVVIFPSEIRQRLLQNVLSHMCDAKKDVGHNNSLKATESKNWSRD